MVSNAMFRTFDQCRANELIVTRIGFWQARYVLSDGVFYYGELSQLGAMRRDMIIETATGKWIVKKTSLFSRARRKMNTPLLILLGLQIILLKQSQPAAH